MSLADLCGGCCSGSGITTRSILLTKFVRCFLNEGGALSPIPAPDTGNAITGSYGPIYKSLAESRNDDPDYGGTSSIDGTNIPSSTWSDDTFDSAPVCPLSMDPAHSIVTYLINSLEVTNMDLPITYEGIMGDELDYTGMIGTVASDINSTLITDALEALTFGISTDVDATGYYLYRDTTIGAFPGNLTGQDYSAYDDTIVEDDGSAPYFEQVTDNVIKTMPASFAQLPPNSPSQCQLGTEQFGLMYLRTQALMTGDYVLINYIIMTDGSLVLDPDTPCAGDGTGDGSTPIDIPVPDLSPLPGDLYISWDDSVGRWSNFPIGRICKLVPYSSCDDYLTDHPDG